MRISIIGGGPAGLYAAILLKRTRADLDISVFEQNASDQTWGFGVVFSDEALEFLRGDDPETADLIAPHMKHWQNIDVCHRGERIAIDGVGFSGIGRLELLQLLQKRAASLGITPAFETRLERSEDAGEADLVIAADGLNSIVRTSAREAFGERLSYLDNRFVWYGAAREFDALTQTFIETPYGRMNAHHYSYAPGRGTFIIEMGAETFERTGFGDMDEPEYRRECERLFAETLEGAPLVANNSIWRRFPVLVCKTWHDGNRVLVGDALHTAHFSIGSGTRLALEDVIALVGALRDTDWDVAAALPAYQARRQPILDKLTAAAGQSSAWYENFDKHMDLEPLPFALSYIKRAGRIDVERLRAMAPGFTSRLEEGGVDLEAA